jgi:hypothetical protein
MDKEVFDFKKEVYIRGQERGIDFVDELRYVEASRFIADFQDGYTEWNIECLIGNYMDYISFEDEEFLDEMINIYEEAELKQYLDDCPNCGAHITKEHLLSCDLGDKNKIWEGIKSFEKQENDFNILEEVEKRNIDVELIKYYDACIIANTIKTMDQSEAEDMIYNGSFSYLYWDDEEYLLELQKRVEINCLKEMIDEVEDIMNDEECDCPKVCDECFEKLKNGEIKKEEIN